MYSDQECTEPTDYDFYGVLKRHPAGLASYYKQNRFLKQVVWSEKNSDDGRLTLIPCKQTSFLVQRGPY